MKEKKNWIKYIYYYITGFLIFIVLSSITQINILKSFQINMDFRTVIIETIKNGIFIYTILYFFILMLNFLYNVILINRLNEVTEKIRNASKEKILKERREITMKKKVLTIILIILFCVLFIFTLKFVKKVNIIKQFATKQEEYQNLNNFYSKTTYTNINNNSILTREIWKKDNEGISKSTASDNTVITEYFNENEILVLTDDNESKEGAILENTMDFGRFSVIQTASYSITNLWDNITGALTIKITDEIVDGKECYKFYISDDFQFIVDKETMLKIKEINADENIELVDYSIGATTDEDVERPSTDGYIMNEN